MPRTQSVPHSPPATLVTWGASELRQLSDGTPVRLRSICPRAARALGEEDHAGVAADDLGGSTVGWATYTRVYGPRAEVTLRVDQSFWHRGLPEELIGDLGAHAAHAGIATFLVSARAVDLPLLALLRAEFRSRETIDGALVRVEFPTA